MTRTATSPLLNARHVYNADGFHRALYDARCSASDPLDRAVGSVAEGVLPVYSDARHPVIQARADADTLAGEVYARLYEGDVLARLQAPAGPAWEQRVHAALDATPEFGDVARQVRGDADFSAMALQGMLGTIASQVADLASDDSDDDGNGKPDSQAARAGVTPGEALAAAMALACSDLQQELQDTKEALNGMAPGLGDAPSRRDDDDPRRLVLAQRLQKDEALRDVLRKAGRLQRMHAQQRKTRSDGFNEVVDVERGSDLSRILPHTLALLDDPDLGDAALADVLQGKALQYALGGHAPLGRGPIVVLRDVSGSMEGQPHQWGAAVCILACQVAHKERRQVTVVNYTGGVQSAFRLDTNRRSHERGSRGDWSPLGDLAEMVLEIACTAAGGGTQLDPVLRYAVDECDLMQDRADLVVVTDGRADEVVAGTLAQVTACKANGLRISGLVINGGKLYTSLAQVCDVVVDLDRPGDIARQAATAVPL